MFIRYFALSHVYHLSCFRSSANAVTYSDYQAEAISFARNTLPSHVAEYRSDPAGWSGAHANIETPQQQIGFLAHRIGRMVDGLM